MGRIPKLKKVLVHLLAYISFILCYYVLREEIACPN